MPPRDSYHPADWYARADDDLAVARMVLEGQGPRGPVAFHIQQALEKGLKGFLLQRGVALRRTHDLELLLSDALEELPGLRVFEDVCESANAFYTYERYPALGGEALDEDELAAHLQAAEALLDAVRNAP